MSAAVKALSARLEAAGSEFGVRVTVQRAKLPPWQLAIVKDYDIYNNENALTVRLNELAPLHRESVRAYINAYIQLVYGRSLLDGGYAVTLARVDVMLRLLSKHRLILTMPDTRRTNKKAGAAEVYCLGRAISDPLLYELPEIIHGGFKPGFAAADTARRLCDAENDLPDTLKIGGKTTSELLSSDNEFIRGLGFRLALLSGDFSAEDAAFVSEASFFGERAAGIIADNTADIGTIQGDNAAAVLRMCGKIPAGLCRVVVGCR